MTLLEKLNAIPRPEFVGCFTDDGESKWYAYNISATIQDLGVSWRGIQIRARKPDDSGFDSLPRITRILGALSGYGRAKDLLAYATWMVEVERVLKEHHE